MNNKNTVEGAQVVARAGQLLKLVARDGGRGARLLDLARAAELPQSTTRRLLKALVEERLLEQSLPGRRYFIGPLAFELGLARHSRPIVTEEFRIMMAGIANQADGAVCLQALVGDDVLCLHRADPDTKPGCNSIRPGDRRPLGGGAGPLAILAKLSNLEIDQTLEKTSSELYFTLESDLRDTYSGITNTRNQGFAVCREMFDRSLTGVGIAFSPQQHPGATLLSISILVDEINEARIETLANLLKRKIKTTNASGFQCLANSDNNFHHNFELHTGPNTGLSN
ncbi:IclR family transcriptional regulator [Sneathiella litorea]|uniref:Helix-turn-helix domain-containing protein n=1 Tax=Sneathiella litorea TaxID=2606216 RepID=A0A6L8W7Y9_9PROT|nr:helix-turn-helix domain-containing protein [Sneathiella litorea]MZR30653.1 helix-turn-helix domain-containing protein [Sneathiella litorea]